MHGMMRRCPPPGDTIPRLSACGRQNPMNRIGSRQIYDDWAEMRLITTRIPRWEIHPFDPRWCTAIHCGHEPNRSLTGFVARGRLDGGLYPPAIGGGDLHHAQSATRMTRAPWAAVGGDDASPRATRPPWGMAAHDRKSWANSTKPDASGCRHGRVNPRQRRHPQTLGNPPHAIHAQARQQSISIDFV